MQLWLVTQLPYYADDCKSSRVINCPSDYEVFQSDLNNLYSWSQQNLMDFNVKKCKLMRVTKRKTSFHSDLQLNDNTLEEASEFCDLGLVTTSRLSWNAHVDKISSKANKILGLIKRMCRGQNDVSTLRSLYCTLVKGPNWSTVLFSGHLTQREMSTSWKEFNEELQSLY